MSSGASINDARFPVYADITMPTPTNNIIYKLQINWTDVVEISIIPTFFACDKEVSLDLSRL